MLPGDLKDVVLREYHFFNVKNAEDILQGASPMLEELNGYIYQEFDNYMNRTYTKYDGTDDAWVSFWPLQYMKKTEPCIWHNGTSVEDPVTLVNIGPFNAWY